jgi:hypothetical protein
MFHKSPEPTHSLVVCLFFQQADYSIGFVAHQKLVAMPFSIRDMPEFLC